MASIGLHATVGILSGISVFGTIYVFLAIKETKGMSLDTQKQRNYGTQSPENGASTSDISQRPWAHYDNSNKSNFNYLCDSDKLQICL